MTVAVTIPDELVTDAQGLSRDLLEAYTIEKFRLEEISLGRLREVLGLSIDEANILLKERRLPSQFDREYLERDRQTIESLLRKY
ncbi:MAG TPA: UPF0175 family protein [Pyrinomonadaceae bacterium]|nr:UPF0175 family protein [Acidobacteriota bacterium]HQZ97886.1 UPF0175 family protein [Pyrinomonadaceae bacterium]